MESKQYYSYALDKNQRLVNVKEATKGEEYLCPHCGGVMIPKQGTKRRWHFAHKGDTGVCSYESYLHKLAKKRIRECFLSEEPFYIELLQGAICPVKECPVGISEKCSYPKCFDLKEYYDCCEEEGSIGDFRADLLLRHSEKIDRKPILIEIWVSHKCTEEKRKSGHKIIEVKIDSEKDIERIVSNARINGIQSENSDESRNSCYNFEPKEGDELPGVQYQRPKFSFGVDSQNRLHRDSYDKSARCLTPNPRWINDAKFLIQSPRPIDLDFAFEMLSRSGPGIRYCGMCHFYKYNQLYEKHMCIRYKTKGTSQFPSQYEAMKCQYFKQIDYDRIDDSLKIDYKEYKITQPVLKI